MMGNIPWPRKTLYRLGILDLSKIMAVCWRSCPEPSNGAALTAAGRRVELSAPACRCQVFYNMSITGELE